MTTLVISDLHLSAQRSNKLDLFDRFVARAKEVAQEIYILGDLFEVWVGDDDDTPPHPHIIDLLRSLSDTGIRLGVQHGNRDFLMGARFRQATGATLLPDYAVVDLYGTRALLTHGDLLCTRDVKYQRFRRVVRNCAVQRGFLAAPLQWRKHIAYRTQKGTRASMSTKSAEIMDVEQATVAAVMKAHGVSLLIHGHTHRPAEHTLEIDGISCQRIVLGDWYVDDDVLVCDEAGRRRMRIDEFIR